MRHFDALPGSHRRPAGHIRREMAFREGQTRNRAHLVAFAAGLEEAMAYISPEEEESLRIQQKIWTVLEYIQDHAGTWLFAWLICVGAFCSVLQDQELLGYLVGLPVFLLMALAIVVVAIAFILRIIGLLL